MRLDGRTRGHLLSSSGKRGRSFLRRRFRGGKEEGIELLLYFLFCSTATPNPLLPELAPPPTPSPTTEAHPLLHWMASVAEESKAISPSVQPGQMQHAHKHPTGLLEPGKKLGTMSSSWRPSSLGMGQSKAGLALPHLHKCAWWVIFGKAAATGITWWLLIRPHRLVTASADAGLASSTLLSKNQKSRCKYAIKHGTFMWCEQDEQHQRMERESELN